MENLLETVRNAVRAIIIQDDKLLVQKKIDGGYSLPGGAPNVDESLIEGLSRECLEEIGCEVEIGRLLYVGDYYKTRETVPVSTRHQVEFFFSCQVPSDYLPHNGHHPDKRQVDVQWLELSSLAEQRLQPEAIKPYLLQLNACHKESPNATYLGTL